MGNRVSSGNVEGNIFAPAAREENIYDHSYPQPPPTRPPAPLVPLPNLPSSHLPPSAVKRSMTISHRTREKQTDSSPQLPGLRRLSIIEPHPASLPITPPHLTVTPSTTSTGTPAPPTYTHTDSASSDDLQSHVLDVRPKDNDETAPLNSSIVVQFDDHVMSVNASKLFEVNCQSLDSSLNPTKGKTLYDAALHRAEFSPINTLFPNSKYTVTLYGRAVTTSQCSNPANIRNTDFHFTTCNPAPKTISVKLRGHSGEPEAIQISSYYDLYNSLVVWSTRKWGCSGEHVMGLYTTSEDGKPQQIKVDHDVLALKDNEVVVVEIKD
ncbi:hypothetical protein EMCRGX_G004221 [Ephydatia muelleri]